MRWERLSSSTGGPQGGPTAEQTYVVVLDAGDEVIASLTALAAELDLLALIDLDRPASPR